MYLGKSGYLGINQNLMDFGPSSIKIAVARPPISHDCWEPRIFAYAYTCPDSSCLWTPEIVNNYYIHEDDLFWFVFAYLKILKLYDVIR